MRLLRFLRFLRGWLLLTADCASDHSRADQSDSGQGRCFSCWPWQQCDAEPAQTGVKGRL